MTGPSSGRAKLMDAIDVFMWSMDMLNRRYKEGYVYSFEEESQFTYTKK